MVETLSMTEYIREYERLVRVYRREFAGWTRDARRGEYIKLSRQPAGVDRDARMKVLEDPNG